MNQKTRMALGLCKYCETPRATDKITCEEHAKELGRSVIEKQHERRARGRCRVCDDLPVEGATLCQKHRDAKAEREKARVEGRKLRGLCRLCDEKQALGKKFCQKHLDISRAHEARIRPRLERRRKDAGMCRECDELPKPEQTLCEKHYAKMLENSRRSDSRAQKKDYKQGKGRFKRSLAHARFVGQEWTLSQEEYEALVSQECNYCRLPHKSGGKGLDRLDNSRGYIQGNVVSCCTECNVARGDNFTPDEMIEFVGPGIRSAKLSRSDDYEIHDDAYFEKVAKEDEEIEARQRRSWGVE